MTKYTPNTRTPYPEASDSPRGNEQMQAIAENLDPLGMWAVAELTDFTTNKDTGLETLPVKRVDGASQLPASPDGYGVSVQVAGYYILGMAVRMLGIDGARLSCQLDRKSTVYGGIWAGSGGSFCWTGSDYVYADVGEKLYPRVDGYKNALTLQATRWWVRFQGPSSTGSAPPASEPTEYTG